MKIKGNTVGTTMPRTNYEQTDSTKADYLKGKNVLDQKIEAAKKAGVDAANNAKTAANNAQNAADNAQSAADDAKTAANNAQTTANNAQSAADNAQTAADNAQTTADNALPKAGGTLTGNLILTEGVHYGDTLPAAGTPGRIFFLRIQ